jgi:hypothetical protein
MQAEEEGSSAPGGHQSQRHRGRWHLKLAPGHRHHQVEGFGVGEIRSVVVDVDKDPRWPAFWPSQDDVMLRPITDNLGACPPWVLSSGPPGGTRV